MESVSIKKYIQQFIRENKITEYCVLLDMLSDAGMDSEYDIATSNTILFNTYIRSRKYSGEYDTNDDADETKLKVDEETGEVIE